MTATVKWYINRFRALSGEELLFRLGQVYKARLDKRQLKKELRPQWFSTRTTQLLFVERPQELYSDPTVNIFGIRFHPKRIKDWHADVSSRKKFPRIYSRLINIRNDRYGSAKHVWELNRMLFLPQLALEYVKDRKEETLNLIVRLLSSWIDQNSYLTGVNWYSNIEINIRLINWALTWDILNIDELVKENPGLDAFVKDKWIPCIYTHCVFSFNNPSRHSSANNHLLSEYAGLFVANCKWKFPESDKWLQYAKNGLETEIILQHSKNGINREETA